MSSRRKWLYLLGPVQGVPHVSVCGYINEAGDNTS